jgi:hypothetical protein
MRAADQKLVERKIVPKPMKDLALSVARKYAALWSKCHKRPGKDTDKAEPGIAVWRLDASSQFNCHSEEQS